MVHRRVLSGWLKISFQNHFSMISAQDCNIEKVLKTQSFSYLRPHPPNLAREPYNTAIYHPDDVPVCVVCSSMEEEKKQHPYLKLLLDKNLNIRNYQSGNYPRDLYSMLQLRATYYGLMTEIDDNIGRVLELLKEIDEGTFLTGKHFALGQLHDRIGCQLDRIH